jgi:uncharacterized protein (TIGR00290 family)
MPGNLPDAGGGARPDAAPVTTPPHPRPRHDDARPDAAAREPVLVSWSGGKDSALALHAALADPSMAVRALVTTVTAGYERVSMHGVRVALLERQARAVGLPLETIRIPPQASNAAYEEAMRAGLAPHAAAGVRRVVFGDLFLEDVRAYREALLAPLGLRGHYPLWGLHTAALARRFVALGFRAVLVCVDPRQLDAAFCGRALDDRLLDELPASADPCGERGEFHSFVHDGPVFGEPVRWRPGETVLREGFHFHDLLPADEP